MKQLKLWKLIMKRHVYEWKLYHILVDTLHGIRIPTEV